MKRADALNLIKLAIADGDLKRATRLYCENRVSRTAYDTAVHEGHELRAKLYGRSARTTLLCDL